MTTESQPTEKEKPRTRMIHTRGASDAVYGLGIIGAWVYYLSHATTIWIGILGVFKGVFWPAILVYELMKFMGM
jgi:hypothetical protein